METEGNVLETAMELEQKSVELYATLARQTESAELASVFRFLADEEKSHCAVINAWRAHAPAPAPGDGEVPHGFDAVFKKLSEQFDRSNAPPLHYHQAYEKALAFEEKAVGFYTELLKEGSEERNTVIMKIIDQENGHAHFLRNLLEFLRNPGEWLENAEWRHAEEY
jgi:rubrerythrin